MSLCPKLMFTQKIKEMTSGHVYVDVYVEVWMFELRSE